MLSSELAWPYAGRVTVNLAPVLAQERCGSARVAARLLLASDELPGGLLDGTGVLGELGLDGPFAVPGTLALQSTRCAAQRRSRHRARRERTGGRTRRRHRGVPGPFTR